MPPKDVIVTVKDTGSSNGKGKLAWIKALAPYAVALLGLAGVALGVWAQIKTGNTGEALKATVEQLNEKTIPRLESTLVELRGDNKRLAETLASVRERLAKLEGERLRPAVLRPVEVREDKVVTKALEDMAAKKGAAIPRLEIQQFVKSE